MNEIIYFKTKEPFDKKVLEEFLSKKFVINDFIWADDFYVFGTVNEIDFSKTYISLDISNDGFNYCYSVFSNKLHPIELKQRIEILKELSKETNIEILSTDDEVAPFSWVLIEPSGQTSTVETKMNDNIIIVDYYNFPFGDFRTKEKITSIEIQILHNICNSIYPNIEVLFSTDGPCINGNFNKVKNSVDNLRNYDNHYEIKPIGKTNWYDKNEKSTIFIQLMKKYHKQISKDLCIFPRNYSELKSTESGTDSEEYCLLLSESKEERIIYKKAGTPRK